MGLKIYLDTCIVIYFIEKHSLFGGKVEALINGLNANDEICFSPLVQMECLVMPLRTRDAPLLKLYDSFFSAQTPLEMSAGVFQQAAQLRADYASLKTPDALHWQRLCITVAMSFGQTTSGLTRLRRVWRKIFSNHKNGANGLRLFALKFSSPPL